MQEKVIIGIVVVSLIAAALFFYLRNREGNQPVILGQQLADAMEKEKARVSQNSANSPLLSIAYTRNRGEWDLLNPTQVELDETLRKLCSSFATMPTTERAEFRGAVSMHEFYTLLSFAKRSCVFALRSGNQDLLRSGLTAVAMIEADRTDFRDILMTLALLHHSASRLGMDAGAEFTSAAKIAEPATSELITGFASRDSQSQNLRSSWGYVEVGADAEVGFAQWGFAPYSPQTDLLQVAKRIASTIEKDSYIVDSIELATELPPIWLESPTDKSHIPLIEIALGGVTISCRLEKGKHPNPDSQQFTIFLIELDSAASAKHLQQMSEAKKPSDYSMMGFASNGVFALLVSRSFVEGTDSFETKASLVRFQEPINLALQQTNL